MGVMRRRLDVLVEIDGLECWILFVRMEGSGLVDDLFEGRRGHICLQLLF
jgi:hypothetical protein